MGLILREVWYNKDVETTIYAMALRRRRQNALMVSRALLVLSAFVV